jgi:hypothetical protein
MNIVDITRMQRNLNIVFISLYCILGTNIKHIFGFAKFFFIIKRELPPFFHYNVAQVTNNIVNNKKYKTIIFVFLPTFTSNFCLMIAGENFCSKSCMNLSFMITYYFKVNVMGTL